MHRLRFVLAHTWLAIVRHDWTAEPEPQRRVRTWLVTQVHRMEFDPYLQWRYHLAMSWFWIATIVPILILFFFFPAHWLRWGVFITLIYSLYANWVSDFTGLHAAWAALRGNQIAEKQDIARAEEHIVSEVQELGDELGEENL